MLQDIAAVLDDIAPSSHNIALRLQSAGVEICPCAFGFI
jgi:hypothetical protein